YHALRASAEVYVAICVDLAEVAGVEPALVADHRLHGAVRKVPGSDIFAADKDLAAFAQLHFAPRQDLADRARAALERMVHADERCCFRKSVALKHREAHALEEIFGGAFERGAAGDDRPELPAKTVVHCAETPPALHKMFARSARELLLRPA